MVHDSSRCGQDNVTKLQMFISISSNSKLLQTDIQIVDNTNNIHDTNIK